MPQDDDSKYITDLQPPSKQRVPRRDLSDPLDTIAHYESGDRNVPNYRFDPGHTAQGHYQITNTNWRSYAPKLGIDTAQYPGAMAAPKEIQRKVAGTMFDEHGFGDWAPYNPQLRQALKRGEGGGQMAHAPQSDDDSKYVSDEDSKYVSPAAPAAPTVQQPRQPAQPKVTSLAQVKQEDEAHIQATEKLSNNIRWHFGDSVLNQFNDLPEDRQIKIARLATQYADADEVKKRSGQPIVESYDWKKRNQDMVGVKGDSILDRGEMMVRQQGGDAEMARRRDAATAATNPLLQSTGVMRWLKETGAQGTAGLLHAASGIGRIAAAGGSPGAQAGVNAINEKSDQLQGVVQQADEHAPMGWAAKKASGVGAGLIEYAPLLAMGHPEGAVASIAAGAGSFGGYSGLQAYGETGDPAIALKEGAKAAPFGALMGVPSRVLGGVVPATVAKGAGYYGIGRAEGMTPAEAAENAAVLSAFAGPELAGEAFNAVVGRATRGPRVGPSIESAAGKPMEPAVKSALDSAFEVAKVSPELAEKAFKTPVIEPPKPIAEQEVRVAPAEQKVEETPVTPLNSPRGTASTNEDAKYITEAPEVSPAAKLPKELVGAKPRYSYGNKRFELTFADDFDKAAYISAQTKLSKADASYVRWAVDQSGLSEADIRAHGRKVRESIKGMAKGAEEGMLDVPQQRSGARSGQVEEDALRAQVREKQRGSFSNKPLDETKPAPPGVKTGAVEDRPFTIMEEPNGGGFVLNVKGSAVEFVSARTSRPEFGTPATIADIYLKPEAQRKGLGSEILRGILDKFQANGDETFVTTQQLGPGQKLLAKAEREGLITKVGTRNVPGVSPDAVEYRIGKAEESKPKKPEPIIGIVGSDGTVSGKADPHRTLDHARTFPDQWTSTDHWHYDPGTETVYWTAGDMLTSKEAKHAAENWLERRGYAVKRHGNYTSWIRLADRIDEPLHFTEDEKKYIAELDKEYGAYAAEHPSTTQPRTPETGRFSHTGDIDAVASELATARQRMQEDATRLAKHTGRDLSTAPAMAVRNYFRQLHDFVNTHAPDKAVLVRQAEDAQATGDLVKARVLAERAFNDVSKAVPVTLRDARERAFRAERWKGQEGFIGEKPEPPKPGPEGVKTGVVADLENERRTLERSLPKHLQKTEREPGTDLTYQELPNKLTKARVEKRIADEGIEATEEWYNKQEAAHPEAGAELTDAFRQLSDHYLTKLANATDPAEIDALTAKAKELAGSEAPRSTGLGQAVQAYAMLDKYTGPEVLLEAARLAERSGEKLPDEIVKDIAKTGQEFKAADEQLTEVRKELTKAEKGLGPGKGPGAGKGAGASRARIEQLRDQQTKLVERRQQAKIRQEQTLAKLERPPTGLDYLTRFNNIIRGLMVSAIPTAIRNYETQGLRFGVERLVDLFAHGMRMADAKDPHISAANIHRDMLRIFQSESRSKAVSIAGEYPKELRRLFATYGAGQVETAQAARTFAGRVDKAFGSVEHFVQTVNWLNQLQEFHIRGAEFLSHLDMLVEREHGKPLEQFMREKGADKLSKESIKDSVDHALEVTFADLPAQDTRVGKYMKSLISFGNLIPPTVSPIPFGRWFYNSWKFNYQFSPLGIADLARTPRQLREARRALQRIEVRPPAKTEVTIARRQVELEKARANVTRLEENAKIERYRTVAKATIGTAFLGAAYAARLSSLAGEKWYEMRVPGTDTIIDARPFAPFVTYLFLAEGLRRSIHGERPFTQNEFLSAIGTSTSATGGAAAIYDKYRRGDWDGVFRFLKTEAGELGSVVLTPVRQVRDFLGEFDGVLHDKLGLPSQSITYDTSTQPGLGPIKASIPYGERIGEDLKPAYKPTSAEPIHTTHPRIAKFIPISKFLGPRAITPKNFVEKEADRLRFDYNEVRPSTGVPAIDQLEEKWMGEYVGKQAAKLGNNPNYARQPDSAKAELYLRPLFAAGRTYARGRLASEHPDLYLKLIERAKSARQRAMEKDFGVKPLANPY